MLVTRFPAGGDVWVDVALVDTDVDSGLSRAGAGERVAQVAAESWEKALDCVHTAAQGVLAQIRRLDPAPEEVKVTFGVAVSGKLGAVLVSSGADAHIQVEVTWRPCADARAGGSTTAAQ